MKKHPNKTGLLALLIGVSTASMQAQVPIPPSAIVTADTSKPGFTWRIFANPGNKVDSTVRTEDALAGLLKDANGDPLPNLADPAAQGVASAPSTAPNPANATISFYIPNTINVSKVAGTSFGTFPDEGQMPGVPATDGSTDGLAVEILTYLDLPAGRTTMGVNSDDGFRITVGDASDVFRAVVPGQYNGGRGAGDSIFDFSVEKAGIYPFRTTYEQGGGDANIEWFTFKADGSTRVLVNDVANGGIKAYSQRVGVAVLETAIKSITPDPVPRQANKVSNSLTVVLSDGDTKTIDDNSIVLQVDGLAVTTTKSRQGKTVSVTYTPTGLQIPTDKHTASLTYKDSAGASRLESWTFYNLKNIVLPPAKITEDFDSYPEDTQPTGWTPWNFTAKCDAGRDITSQSSASYENWVLVSVGNAPSIDGGAQVTPDKIAPGQTFNGVAVTNISSGNILYAESDSRCGNSDPGDGSNWGQTQFIISKPFDCSALTNVVLTFSSLYTQNQDSYGGVEYSVDGGTNWLPIVYFLDGPDIILNPDGSVDALSTFVSTNRNRDTSGWFDNGAPKGAAPGGHGYGDAVAAPITQALGIYVAPRVNDDQVEGARIEVFRLAKAGKQKDVRLRFGAMGTDSWWFAVDNIAFYDVPSASTPLPPPPASGNPTEFGQTVNGFQDDFTAATRDPNWLPIGPGGDLYKQEGGVLKVSVTAGDPNHLVYVGAGGSNTVEEVLARIRVVGFATGDPSRAGIGVGVSTNKSTASQGLNLHFRDNAQDNVPGRQFKMLDDGRAWGPPGLRTNIPGQTGLGWSNDTWYWLRLRLDPKADGTNTAYGKVWVADGTTAEPDAWQLIWKDSAVPKPLRTGFAGITGSSIGGVGQFEVDYILIKSAGLPGIKVDFAPTGAATKTPPSFTSVAQVKTSVVLDWFGGGTLQYADQILGPWTTATNALPPLTVPLTGAKAVGPQRFYRFAETVLNVTLSGAAEKPNAVVTSGTGSGSLTIVGNTLTYNIAFSGLSGAAAAAHIHGPADASTAAGVIVPLSVPKAASGIMSGTIDLTTLTAAQVAAIKTGNAYVNIHTAANGGGEIRGQLKP